MAPHSSTRAWKIPWTEEPGRLQSMGSRRVGHDWVTSLSFHFYALEKEMATHSSVLAWRIRGMGEPGGLPSMGSAQSWTRLKWLSSSSSSLLDPSRSRLGLVCSYTQVYLLVWALKKKILLDQLLFSFSSFPLWHKYFSNGPGQYLTGINGLLEWMGTRWRILCKLERDRGH